MVAVVELELDLRRGEGASIDRIVHLSCTTLPVQKRVLLLLPAAAFPPVDPHLVGVPWLPVVRGPEDDLLDVARLALEVKGDPRGLPGAEPLVPGLVAGDEKILRHLDALTAPVLGDQR